MSADGQVSRDTSAWDAWGKCLREMGEGLGAAINAYIEAVKPVWDLLVEQLEVLVEQIAPILRVLGEEMWRQYRAAGSPYGDTHDGLMRWLREASEAQRLRSQAETIEQRWRDQADLREWGRRMRERRAHKG